MPKKKPVHTCGLLIVGYDKPVTTAIPVTVPPPDADVANKPVAKPTVELEWYVCPPTPVPLDKVEVYAKLRDMCADVSVTIAVDVDRVVVVLLLLLLLCVSFVCCIVCRSLVFCANDCPCIA